MSLWALLPAALSLGATYLSKPKKKDFRPNTDYLKRYIANLRGRQSDREAYHMAMQPALRQIGAQGRRAQRQIGYDVEKSGLAGSGIEAQQRLTASRDVLGAMQTASEKATGMQLQESRRLGQQAEQGQIQIGAEEDRARRAYEQSQSQWRNQMLQGGVNLASAGVTKYIEGLQAAKQAAQTAPTIKTFIEGDQQVQKQWDPKTQSWDVLGEGSRWKPTDVKNIVDTIETTYDAEGKATTVHKAGNEVVKTVTKDATPEKLKDPKAVRVTEEFDKAGNKTITEFDKDDNVLKIKNVEVKPEKPGKLTTFQRQTLSDVRGLERRIRDASGDMVKDVVPANVEKYNELVDMLNKEGVQHNYTKFEVYTDEDGEIKVREQIPIPEDLQVDNWDVRFNATIQDSFR